ncbi:MAG: DUF2281 domain-containing protein [Myxacorys californica WJT36-NPBG1]|nr:DUF2281 domain-containing protein [Myxacorys californica WJT36-NPBG1]
MMAIPEQIYEIVKTLPPEQANEILTFAKFIRAKHLNANRSTKAVDVSDASMPWSELVHSLSGAWADDFPTLEEIRMEIGQDIRRESL